MVNCKQELAITQHAQLFSVLVNANALKFMAIYHCDKNYKTHSCPTTDVNNWKKIIKWILMVAKKKFIKWVND